MFLAPRLLAWLVVLLAATFSGAAANAGNADTSTDDESAPAQCVVLLHGLARSHRSMQPLADYLQAQGYAVVNKGYESTTATVEQLTAATMGEAIAQCPQASTLHFVTHSMGGILVRQFLAGQAPAALGRVVMLAPPNQGSEVVDKLADVPGFYWLNGPAGQQLGTTKSSLPNSLGAANFDVGVIAGSRSINLLLSLWLPNPDDGKVSVARTRLAGMRDHLVLPVSHPFIMRDEEAMRQVLHYLRSGQFDHAEN